MASTQQEVHLFLAVSGFRPASTGRAKEFLLSNVAAAAGEIVDQLEQDSRATRHPRGLPCTVNESTVRSRSCRGDLYLDHRKIRDSPLPIRSRRPDPPRFASIFTIRNAPVPFSSSSCQSNTTQISEPYNDSSVIGWRPHMPSQMVRSVGSWLSPTHSPPLSSSERVSVSYRHLG